MLNPLIVFPVALLFVYLIDIVSILIRRSTHGVRKHHHWLHRLKHTQVNAEKLSTAELSEQYLPGNKWVIGSLPNHLAVVSLCTYISIEWENPYLQLIIAVTIFEFVSFISRCYLCSRLQVK